MGQERHDTSKAQRTETVEVTALPLVISVPLYDVRAGDHFSFIAALDHSANVAGAVLQYSVSGPSHIKAVGNCSLAPYPRQSNEPFQYRCDFAVPAIGPAGTWRIRSLYLYFAVGDQKVRFTNWQDIKFRVLPNSGLVLPTLAFVTINIPQTQLLRSQAARLQERIQLLKVAISKYETHGRSGQVAPLLKQNLVDAMESLSATKSEFIQLASAGDQNREAEVFFDDLRTSYQDAIVEVTRTTASSGNPQEFLLIASKAPYEGGADPLVAEALRPLEQNELAYNLVATTGSLTFDLEVDSNPPGASVSYHRRGDAWQPNPNPTNSTLHSLPYAIWIVKFEKPGYKTEEREHDPFRESNHVVSVELER